MYRYCLSGPWHSFCTSWNEAQIFLSLLAACSLSVFHSRICTCHHNPKVFKSCSAHWFNHKITTNQESRQDCQFEAIARRPLAVVSSLHLEFVCGMNTSFNTCCWCIALDQGCFFQCNQHFDMGDAVLHPITLHGAFAIASRSRLCCFMVSLAQFPPA